MAESMLGRSMVAPNPRLPQSASTRGYFFPREVAEILGIGEIEYSQLRRLFKLARRQQGRSVAPGDRRWSRYTLRDIAAVEAALQLAGGKSKLQPGQHLAIRLVEDAVDGLLAMGVTDPLLEVQMERQGVTIVAAVSGALVDPSSGQLLLRRVYSNVAVRLDRGEADVARLLREERTRKLGQARDRVEAFQALA